MSATLQIIAVIKTLGVITRKDHSLAPVSQGTKVMDTIVQVKFFVFFQIPLKQFALAWEVTDDMLWNQWDLERECVLTVNDYMIILYWWLYWLLVCSGRINLIFTLIITQTQTNAWTTLTIVAKMPPAPTSKGPSTVVASQGTLEMATTVQVGSWHSCLAFR